MKAMILAAGRGERLRPLTETVPKPLIPIHGEPLIVHQLRWLVQAGIHEVIINVCHLANQIIDALGTGQPWGCTIQWSREEQPLETGGGIANAMPLIGNKPFLVLNGDVWTSYPFGSLVDKELSGPHLVLTPKPAHKPAGDFMLVGDRVRRPCEADRDLTYCGIGIFPARLFLRPQRSVFSLSRDLLFREAEAGRVTGERFDGSWYDIGTPDQLTELRDSLR